jgi:hypothetical protein
MPPDPKALIALFGEPSVEGLRYIYPLGRYVFLVAMIFFFFDVAQNRGWIKNGRPAWIALYNRRTLSTAAFVSILALCILVLLISWTNGGTQDYSAIGGLLPYSDAAGYFDGAERLLHDGILTSWAERRPLNAAFFAARLFISGENFYIAMVIQAIVVATVLFLASTAIGKLQGTSTSLVFFAINFAFLSGCLYRTLSEPLGVSFGLISFALYWSSIAERNLAYYSFATFFLALALLTRAGAMLELLASIIFAMLFFARDWRMRCVAFSTTCAAVAGGWLLNAALVRMYGTGGALLSNFSYVIYGLSQGGKNWSQAAIDFPQLTGDESHIASFLYQKAFETIVSNPLLLVTGLARSLSNSLVYFPRDLFYLLADASDGGAPWKPVHAVVPEALLIPVTVYGVFRLTSGQRATLNRFHLFLLFQIAGFTLSLPFFYQEGGMRLTAATFPFLAAAVAMILAACKTAVTFPKQVDVPQIQRRTAIALGLAIVAISLTAPLASRMWVPAPAFDAVTCADKSNQFQITLGVGTAYINILDGNVASVLPDVRRSAFRVSDINEMKDFWQTIATPLTVVSSFDYVSRSIRLVSGPVGFASGPRRVVSLCATSLGNGIFSYHEPAQKTN